MAEEKGWRQGKREEGEEKKGEGMEEEGKGDVSTYLLSFCCDVQVWSCEATLLILIDNVYLRATSAGMLKC